MGIIYTTAMSQAFKAVFEEVLRDEVVGDNPVHDTVRYYVLPPQHDEKLPPLPAEYLACCEKLASAYDWPKAYAGFWPDAEPPACECGVKFTGGIHSDWCPAHD